MGSLLVERLSVAVPWLDALIPLSLLGFSNHPGNVASDALSHVHAAITQMPSAIQVMKIHRKGLILCFDLAMTDGKNL